MKNIKAAIFDFDGVIVSSKMAEYESWRRMFQVYNCTLTIRQWIKIIDNAKGEFDPASILVERCSYGDKINIKTIRNIRNDLYSNMVNNLKPLPGIINLIKSCHERGILLGMASNGTHSKLEYHLSYLNLIDFFCVIKGRDDVGEKRKPYPDIYLSALEDLNVKSEDVVVFEDSPPGISAAKSAGLFCVGVPNMITKYLDLGEADIICTSLKNFSIEELRCEGINE